MIAAETITVYCAADVPFVSNSPDLIAGWKLGLQANRRGWCRVCQAHIEWPPLDVCRIYRKLHRRPPTRLLHDPRCPASVERLQAEIRAGWS
jgi:hypothetical protein